MSRYLIILVLCIQFIMPVHLRAQTNVNESEQAQELEKPTCTKSTKNSIVQQISLVVAATLGSRLPFVCKPHGFKTPSILAYSAGALVYILSEVMAASKVKKDSGEIAAEYENKENSSQKDALDAQKKIDEANLKALKVRLRGESIMKIAGTIATALAAVEAFMVKNPTTMSWAQPMFSGVCQSNKTVVTGTRVKKFSIKDIISPSGLKTNALCILLGFSMFTKGGSIMTTGMCGLTAFAMKKLDKPFTKLAQKPLGRAALMGVSTGIVMLGSGSTKKAKSCLEKHIAYNEQVINQLEGSNGGATTITGSGLTTISNGALIAEDGSNYGFNWDPDLQAHVPIEARRINIPKIQLPKGLNSNVLEASANKLNSLTDNLKNGRIGQANADAAFLANNAAKIEKIKNKLVKKANDQRVTSGQKPIDFDAYANKKVASIQRAIGQAYNNQAAQTGFAAAGTLNKADKDSDKITRFNSINDSKGSSAGSANKSNGMNINMNDDDFLNDDSGSLAEKMANSNYDSENMNNYVLDGNEDINPSQASSIFSILSYRYKNTAYDQLLERKK